MAVQPRHSMPSPRLSNTYLGSLDRLPMELLFQVCRELDVCSLFTFRQINLRANQVVASLSEYRVMFSHGLNTLCALLRTGLGLDVTVSKFYKAICTKNCVLCGQFGGFIFLPTWTRCCFECLQQASETQMETLISAQRRLGLTQKERARIGFFRPLPGLYSMRVSRRNFRAKLVSTQRANVVSGRGTAENWQQQARRPDATLLRKFRFMASCALPFFDVSTGMVEYGVSCSGCQLAIEKGLIGSTGEDWAWSVRDKVYSHEEFLAHFKWCEQAQLSYKSSENGTIEPADTPEGARKGGYFTPRD